jgi:hypothetical protein
MGATLRLREALDSPHTSLEEAELQALIAPARKQLGPDAFAGEQGLGTRLVLDEQTFAEDPMSSHGERGVHPAPGPSVRKGTATLLGLERARISEFGLRYAAQTLALLRPALLGKTSVGGTGTPLPLEPRSDALSASSHKFRYL